ncbi:TATA box-binding protein-associated factor RNA polymerase I subunit B [Hoplias malabaricus]|uniref:TATA box-binding protein-associated factor RNA polymerase I subunit B n=1 Tax=Hoplias malabaricus TaxID=27720 RepID=UPI0034626DD0
MDEDLTEGYGEPCAQCGAVCWALTDGQQFFCKNCHNVIERTQEVVDERTFIQNNRITYVTSRSRTKTGREGGRSWLVVEGFQFILKHQAEALVRLGVCPEFKTNVLWDFWKRYLQKTRQAYTRAPLRSNLNPVETTSESEAGNVSDASDQRKHSSAGYSSDEKYSVCSGSLDAEFYICAKERKSHCLMNMPRTLALCHLALLWLREAITLADLLRLVSKGHVPYINVHEDFPEQMKFFGKDAYIFRAETIPSYKKVQEDALQLAKLLKLPAFPPVTEDCLLHPGLLSLRYLIELNLPDQLHYFVCQVMEDIGMGNEHFLTFGLSRPKYALLCYDVQAAALIIVTMKLFFRLDDKMEWTLHGKLIGTEQDSDDDDQGKSDYIPKRDSEVFNFRRWYMIMQAALEQARKREQLFDARRQWKSKQPIIPSLVIRSVFLKRRRMVEQLQSNFYSLTGSAPEQQPSTPPSFVFLWGPGQDADGPSLHHKHLNCMLYKLEDIGFLVNGKYWHPDLKICHEKNCRRNHYTEQEHTFPRTYVWLLELFSFLLGVKKAMVHNEVIKVERLLLRRRTASQGGPSKEKVTS